MKFNVHKDFFIMKDNEEDIIDEWFYKSSFCSSCGREFDLDDLYERHGQWVCLECGKQFILREKRFNKIIPLWGQEIITYGSKEEE